MKHRIVKFSILLFGLGLTVQAQQTIISSGGNATGTGGSVSYSIGQAVYTTNSGPNGSASQGIQQAYEIYLEVSKEETELSSSISVFPNPASDHLTLQVKDFKSSKLIYHLFDLQGRELQNKHMSENETKIDMSGLQSATYFIHVSQENSKFKSFKIIKK